MNEKKTHGKSAIGTAVLAARKQRGRPFAKGRSGNPCGRPAGSRNNVSLAVEELLASKVTELSQSLIDRALGGSTEALRLALDRICPVRRDRAVEFSMPKIGTAADVLAAQECLLRQVANGTITPSEAQAIGGLLESRRRTIETVELEARLAALEARGGTT